MERVTTTRHEADVPSGGKVSGANEPNLNRYDSVRDHLRERLIREVEELEARIRDLNDQNAPHTSIMLNSYQRVIDRKRAFLDRWC